MLLSHSNRNKYNYADASWIIAENINARLIKELPGNERILSQSAKADFVYMEYLNHNIGLQYSKDSNLRNAKGYDFETVGINITDSEKIWNKALNEDNPVGVQLIDKDGSVALAYSASMIPRFVVIDKSGNVINFDAPRPGSGEKLNAILDRQLRN